jgi:hypothetical protein
VLQVVGKGQVHQVRPLAFENLDPSREHELAQVRAVDIGQRHADEFEYALDAVLGQRRLIRPLGGEANAVLHSVTEKLSQLVLGGDHCNLAAKP